MILNPSSGILDINNKNRASFSIFLQELPPGEKWENFNLVLDTHDLHGSFEPIPSHPGCFSENKKKQEFDLIPTPHAPCRSYTLSYTIQDQQKAIRATDSCQIHLSDISLDKNSELFQTVQEGNEEYIRKWLQNNPTRINALFIDETGRQEETSLLYEAIKNSQVGIVELILSTDSININQPCSRDAKPPLYLAVELACLDTDIEEDKKKIVELLLDKGADIHARNKLGSTILYIAIDKINGFNKEMIEFLLQKGATSEIDVPHISGDYPLHTAVLKGPHITKVLIDNGADVNVRRASSKSNYNYTPLYLAVQREDYKTAELLLHAKANPDLPEDENGTTPLHIAVNINSLNQALQFVNLLLQHKANPLTQNNKGKTALDIANETWGSDSEIAKRLQQAKSEYNKPK